VSEGAKLGYGVRTEGGNLCVNWLCNPRPWIFRFFFWGRSWICMVPEKGLGYGGAWFWRGVDSGLFFSLDVQFVASSFYGIRRCCGRAWDSPFFFFFSAASLVSLGDVVVCTYVGVAPCLRLYRW